MRLSDRHRDRLKLRDSLQNLNTPGKPGIQPVCGLGILLGCVLGAHTVFQKFQKLTSKSNLVLIKNKTGDKGCHSLVKLDLNVKICVFGKTEQISTTKYQ